MVNVLDVQVLCGSSPMLGVAKSEQSLGVLGQCLGRRFAEERDLERMPLVEELRFAIGEIVDS